MFTPSEVKRGPVLNIVRWPKHERIDLYKKVVIPNGQSSAFTFELDYFL